MEPTNNPVKNIYQRINLVMQEVDYIQRGEKKVAGQFRYVSHDQVSSTLHGPMTKHGIACIPSVVEMRQDGNRTEIMLEVTFINIDNPSDMFSVVYWGYGVDSSDKGIGKAISYAFKYALLKTFVLETGDDPDQDQASVYEPPKPKIQEVTPEELEEYICSFGEDASKFTDYVTFVATAKKCNPADAVALCKKGGDNTVKAFQKWKEKQK